MGIRFYCPQGHKLNVKSFLAGKRGICPHCGARMRIPLESQIESSKAMDRVKTNGSAVTETAPAERELVAEASPVMAGKVDDPFSTTTQGQMPSVPQATLASSTAQAVPTKVDPIEEAPETVWYVRPPSGGQFGPARGEIMRRWVNEGRVNNASLVWREGWPDWRKAEEVFPELCDDFTPPPPGASTVEKSEAPIDIPESPTAAKQYNRRKRESRGTAVMVVIGLGVLCVVLGVVFAIVAFSK